jgi:hypothetical protein
MDSQSLFQLGESLYLEFFSRAVLVMLGDGVGLELRVENVGVYSKPKGQHE